MEKEAHTMTIEELYSFLEKKNIFYVTLRSGKRALLKLEEIRDRIEKLAFNTNDSLCDKFIDINLIVQKVCQGM